MTLATAKANGIDPHRWLTDHSPDCPPRSTATSTACYRFAEIESRGRVLGGRLPNIDHPSFQITGCWSAWQSRTGETLIIVASGRLVVADGAQEAQCMGKYMSIPGAARRSRSS